MISRNLYSGHCYLQCLATRLSAKKRDSFAAIPPVSASSVVLAIGIVLLWSRPSDKCDALNWLCIGFMSLRSSSTFIQFLSISNFSAVSISVDCKKNLDIIRQAWTYPCHFDITRLFISSAPMIEAVGVLLSRHGISSQTSSKGCRTFAR